MYSFESRVRYSECDRQCKLSLLSLINYLQDCAIFHSEELGLGIDHMRQVHQSWLLAAWQIEIDQLPKLGERITVSAWCHSMGRRLASRNFTICDDVGTQLVRADSLWFLYDFALGRPTTIPDEQFAFVSDDAPLDMLPTKRKLPVAGPFTEAPSVTVEEVHLDINRHVNNAQYLGMAVNALSSAFGLDEGIAPDDIARICVQYRKQARLGDVVVPHIHETDAIYTVDLTDPTGDSYAVVRIEPRD